jgi:UDP-glucuronate 4-epimerase
MSDAILITGGAGYIGSHLADRLIDRGRRVVCLDNFDSYYDRSYKERNVAGVVDSDLGELIEGDIRQVGKLRALVTRLQPAAIVHLAARPGVRQSLTNPRVYMDNNLTGTLNVLQAAREAGVPRIVFASTSSVYGTVEGPANEDQTPCRPLSPYGASKVGAEALCSSFAQSGAMSILALRFFTVIGPRQRPDMALPQFARKIACGEPIRVFGDGSSMRDYTYVLDLVDALEAAISVDYSGYTVLNVGGGHPVALNKVIRVLEDKLGKTADQRFEPVHPVDPHLTFADIGKARELLGYEPHVGIEEAVSSYVDWYRQQESKAEIAVG